ncbi:MAG: hypothetical protein ABWX90_03885 [Candidatus Saccharimonadales bacterium]
MFPSSEDITMRAAGVQISAPTPPDEHASLESVCAFITARLRYDFISGKDTVNAYVDITQPWLREGYPAQSAHNNAVMYVHALEDRLFQTLDQSSELGPLDPSVDIYFRKVIIRSRYHGRYRLSVSGDVINKRTLLAAA